MRGKSKDDILTLEVSGSNSLTPKITVEPAEEIVMKAIDLKTLSKTLERIKRHVKRFDSRNLNKDLAILFFGLTVPFSISFLTASKVTEAEKLSSLVNMVAAIGCFIFFLICLLNSFLYLKNKQDIGEEILQEIECIMPKQADK